MAARKPAAALGVVGRVDAFVETLELDEQGEAQAELARAMASLVESGRRSDSGAAMSAAVSAAKVLGDLLVCLGGGGAGDVDETDDWLADMSSEVRDSKV